MRHFCVISIQIPGLSQYNALKIKHLAPRHNTVPLVKFEPKTSWSQVWHSIDRAIALPKILVDLFAHIDALHPSQQFFSHVKTFSWMVKHSNTEKNLVSNLNLFKLLLYIPVNNFSVLSRHFLGLNWY